MKYSIVIFKCSLLKRYTLINILYMPQTRNQSCHYKSSWFNVEYISNLTSCTPTNAIAHCMFHNMTHNAMYKTSLTRQHCMNVQSQSAMIDSLSWCSNYISVDFCHCCCNALLDRTSLSHITPRIKQKSLLFRIISRQTAVSLLPRECSDPRVPLGWPPVSVSLATSTLSCPDFEYGPGVSGPTFQPSWPSLPCWLGRVVRQRRAWAGAWSVGWCPRRRPWAWAGTAVWSYDAAAAAGEEWLRDCVTAWSSPAAGRGSSVGSSGVWQ